MDKPFDEKAEFNDSLGYLTRINRAFWLINLAKYERKPFDWLSGLIIINDELSTEMPDEDKQKYAALILDLNTRCHKEYDPTTGYFSSVLFTKLHSFELELRMLYKKSGLQMKMQDSALKALR